MTTVMGTAMVGGMGGMGLVEAAYTVHLCIPKMVVKQTFAAA